MATRTIPVFAAAANKGSKNRITFMPLRSINDGAKVLGIGLVG